MIINFACFSFATACLVGLGQNSLFLPALAGGSLATSLLLTDHLGLIRLNRLAAYTVMLIGAIAAIIEFFRSGRIDQLTAVSKLLVYVQIGLMFQVKDRRVFEHWAVFLLLEMIVASLLNDNLLYGILLIPMLGIGCSMLLAYASYTARLDPTPEPASRL